MNRTIDVYYLGHSGFAVDTGVTMLVFDYWETTCNILRPIINQKDRKVVFFSSHRHHDHYDDVIEGYKKMVDVRAHITGWRSHDQSHTYIKPHVMEQIEGIQVMSLVSNDAGCAFFVMADGVNVFHGGDLAGWEDETKESFNKEIDFLRLQGYRLDLSFLAVTSFTGDIQKTMVNAAAYFIDSLKPSFFIPMHSNFKDYLYKEFKKEYFPGDKRIICPEFQGEKIRIDL
jgi:L-ascorbate metabolism protein UlaG (beta-lactamase superfamily)